RRALKSPALAPMPGQSPRSIMHQEQRLEPSVMNDEVLLPEPTQPQDPLQRRTAKHESMRSAGKELQAGDLGPVETGVICPLRLACGRRAVFVQHDRGTRRALPLPRIGFDIEAQMAAMTAHVDRKLLDRP